MNAKLICDFCMAVQVEGFEIPISIEVDFKSALALQKEVSHVLRYSTFRNLKHNEFLYNGVLIVAPKNFIWDEK